MKDDGIYEEWDHINPNNGDVIDTLGRMLLPKDVFVEAFNKYIGIYEECERSE